MLGRTDVQLKVTFTDRRAEIRGTVVSRSGRVPVGARVVLFDRDRIRRGYDLRPTCVALASVNRSGGFVYQFANRCRFLVAAVSDLPEFWMAPEYLESLEELAVPVDVGPGQSRVVDLPLRP